MDVNSLTLLNRPLTSLKEVVNIGDKFLPRSNLPAQRYAFRGQAKSRGTLTPSFAREITDWESDGAALALESFLMREFRSRYASLYEPTSSLPPPKLIGEGYDLRCLSVMQHYGIPTRLLDWTSSFWIALYFACSEEPDEVAEVWFYDRKLFDRSDTAFASLEDRSNEPQPEPPILTERFPHLLELDVAISPRMKSQQALHTFCTRPCFDHAELLANKGPQEGTPGGTLRRILIDPTCKSAVLSLVEEFYNITAASLFPDLTGVAHHLRGQLRSWAAKLP